MPPRGVDSGGRCVGLREGRPRAFGHTRVGVVVGAVLVRCPERIGKRLTRQALAGSRALGATRPGCTRVAAARQGACGARCGTSGALGAPDVGVAPVARVGRGGLSWSVVDNVRPAQAGPAPAMRRPGKRRTAGIGAARAGGPGGWGIAPGTPWQWPKRPDRALTCLEPEAPGGNDAGTARSVVRFAVQTHPTGGQALPPQARSAPRAGLKWSAEEAASFGLRLFWSAGSGSN